MVTSPIPITPYLSLLEHSYDEQYVEKWQSFNQWARDHIPFVGATLKPLIFDLALDNKLVKNKLIVNKERVDLKTINANLLVVSTTDDELVPEELTSSIMDLVSSKDKLYKRVRGGHASIAIKGRLPEFIEQWLSEHS